MKIGRINQDNVDQYGVIIDNDWYPQEMSRGDDGREQFLYQEYSPQFGKCVNLTTTNLDWLPPIAFPGKILCIGRNYAEHSQEQGKEPESTPLIFSKFQSSMIGHSSNIPYPPHTNYLDYEVELAVIIGKKASKLDQDADPLSYVYGYTIANDLTARDVQKSEKQWTRGKGFDNSLPIGPYIVTTDETGPLKDNDIWLTVNGEYRQKSKLSNMIFDIPYLIKYISQVISLHPGDIILTGTPEGVGYYMDPKQTLQIGDTINCGIDGIGTLEFTITERETNLRT